MSKDVNKKIRQCKPLKDVFYWTIWARHIWLHSGTSFKSRWISSIYFPTFSPFSFQTFSFNIQISYTITSLPFSNTFFGFDPNVQCHLILKCHLLVLECGVGTNMYHVRPVSLIHIS